MAFRTWLLVFFLGVELSAFVLLCVESKYIKYNTTSTVVPGKLNVHLVPHSHDDVGWLKTIDQYYVGSNNTIQGACVQDVLDSIVPALLADKNRKFIFVEQAFFQRWWSEQSEEIQRIVKKLVSSGQLELINGGMCMHDEATVHYIDMIDQTTLGHRFIKEEFNVTPRIGWQIDPFGHSAVQAYLLGAEKSLTLPHSFATNLLWEAFLLMQLGFDSLFFARIDYQDRAKRKNEKSLEVIWRGSKSLGPSAQIFTGAFPKHYDPPSNFYFEVNDDSTDSPIVQDNINLFDYNVPQRINEFVAAAVSQANVTRTNHIMWTMGTDFKYQYAHTWFRQMDKFLHYVNQAARQLEFFKGRNKLGPNTDSLAEALAVVQHHDAVSGTEKQHVADDYAKRISIGYKEAEDVVAASLAVVANLTSKTGWSPQNKFQQCPLLNISYCPPSEVDLSNGKNLVIVVYNPLGRRREDVVRIPVINENVAVWDSSGKEIESQLLPLLDVSVEVRKYHVKAYLGKSPKTTPSYWLAFSATVPPLGFSTYIVSSSKRADATSVRQDYKSESRKDGTIQVGPGKLKLIYSGNQGNLAQYINSKSLVKESVQQSYLYYRGDEGNQTVNPQASGAYIFRPNGTYPIKSDNKAPFTVFRGPLLDELHQRINSWIYQITRVYKEKEHVEVEFLVGPIPFGDKIGKEVVTQITTTLKNNKTFYTDSSGRDFIERIRDYRKDWDLEVNEPIAGNYYPVSLICQLSF
nr:probable alpha-mannosidase At5g13980 isoform X3 [Quercus suber]